MSQVETHRVPHIDQLRAFQQAVPELGAKWLQSAECTDEVRGAVLTMRERASQESPSGSRLINRAVDLAIPLYQLNVREPARFRKYQRHGYPRDPYVIHPLQVGLHSIGEPVRLEAVSETAVNVLHAVQEPYDSRVVAASPLHDGPEDVTGIVGFGEIPVSTAWENLVKSYLGHGAGSDQEEVAPETVNDVWSIIHAVTNPSPDEVRAMRPEILRNPFVRDVIGYLQARAGDQMRADAVPDQIVSTIAARHMLLSRTLGNDFVRLASCYLKSADRANNMNTAGTNLGKLYDAHFNAELARLLGLPIATITMFGLSKNGYSIGHNPGSVESDFHEKKMREQYVIIENDRNMRREQGLPMPEMHFSFPGSGDMHSYPIAANQIPITTQTERRGSISSDPALQFAVSIPDRQILEELMRTRTIDVIYDKSKSRFKARRILCDTCVEHE
ncbi:hypothetical protein HYS00_02340 [Candidatus Microgenomates bacterium]|nr:hypothetical protein [Candidatus Microgenomates bacterium]